MKKQNKWFEIPVTNFDRACNFYSKVLDVEMKKQKLPTGNDMGFFKHAETGKIGALVQNSEFVPNSKSVLVYLDVKDMNRVVSKITGAGGKVILPKYQVSKEIGYLSVFYDSEGNKMALQSNE